VYSKRPESLLGIAAAAVSAALFWYLVDLLRRFGAPRAVRALTCWVVALAIFGIFRQSDRTQPLYYVVGGVAFGGILMGFLAFRTPAAPQKPK